MTISLPKNRFKAALNERRTQIGLWCSLVGSVAAEICAGAAFDWLLIDGEHSPNDIVSFLSQLQAVEPYSTSAIIRPPVGNTAIIKQMLDIGAQNLLIPMVETVAQTQALVAATRYPPHGNRGVSAQTRAGRWGRVGNYLNDARDEICLIVQIETETGLANIDEIVTLDGVDAVFVGPADLAAALGHLGQPGHADVQRAVDCAIRSIHAAGKPAGILTVDEKLAHHYVAMGVAFVAVGMDTMILAQATSALRRRFT